MNRYRNLFKNTGLIFLGQLASKFLTYVFLPLYTYILTTEEYGTYDLVTTTISLLAPVITFDISEAVFRFVLDKEKSKAEVFSIGFYTICLAVVIGFALRPIITLIPAIEQNWSFFVLLLASGILNTFLMQFVKGSNQIKLYSLAGILNTAFVLILNILFLVVLHMGIKGYFLTYIVSGILMDVILLFAIKFWKYLLPIHKISKTRASEIFHYSIPMIPNSICWWISNSSDKFMLQLFVSTAVVGVYSVSYKIPSALTIISSIFMSAWSISAVEEFEDRKNKAQDMYSKVYNAYIGAIGISVSILILLAKPMALVLYQKEFYIAWKSSVILLLAFFFNGLSAFVGTIYVSAKKTKMLFYSTLIAAAINIVLNFLMIPKAGMYGAGLATLVSYAVVWLVRLIHSKKIICFQKDVVIQSATIVILIVQVILTIRDIRCIYIINIFAAILIAILNMKNVAKLLKSANEND